MCGVDQQSEMMEINKYYEYIMAYVDDVLAISEKAVDILKEIKSGDVKFKNDKIVNPLHTSGIYFLNP